MAGRVLFLPLDALYPECRVFLREHPSAVPMACLEGQGCPLGLGARCMGTLVRRLGRLFAVHDALEHVIAYWTLPPGEVRGIRFDRQLSAPSVAALRPAYLRHYVASGEPFAVPDELFR